MSIDVDRLREDTPGTRTLVHLNNAGAALPPEVVLRTVVGHLEDESRLGPYEAHAAAADRVAAITGSAARLVGVRPDQVALVESATEGWSRAFSAIEFTRGFGPGDRILVAESEYASNVLPILQVCARTGARLEFVPDGPDGSLDVAALGRMLDDDVALVALTHCPSQNGLVNDVAGAGAVLADAPAWFVVDACQSVGQLAVDAAEIGADFLSATGRKWLRGPRGTGFLAVSDRALAELEPFPLDLHSAEWTADGYRLAEGARRFEYWERSYAALLGMGAALDYALACGIDALQPRIDALATRARQGLGGIPGVRLLDRGERRSGIVTFLHAATPAPAIASALRGRSINVSVSTPDYARHDFEAHDVSAAVRVSPHAYNTEDEVDVLIAAVAGAVR
jgi:selenocysteine lyase/cysteine desulfurase